MAAASAMSARVISSRGRCASKLWVAASTNRRRSLPFSRRAGVVLDVLTVMNGHLEF